jgi:hypothetical protein
VAGDSKGLCQRGLCAWPGPVIVHGSVVRLAGARWWTTHALSAFHSHARFQVLTSLRSTHASTPVAASLVQHLAASTGCHIIAAVCFHYIRGGRRQRLSSGNHTVASGRATTPVKDITRQTRTNLSEEHENAAHSRQNNSRTKAHTAHDTQGLKRCCIQRGARAVISAAPHVKLF